MIKIAITKGRVEKSVCKILKKSGYDTSSIENKNRELIVKTKDDFEIIFLKSNDVIKMIERGIVDIGIVGKDTIEENEFKDYYEILDLGTGKCYFALSSFPDYKEKVFNGRKRIATKYPNIAKSYFNSQNEDIEIIKMEGSVELGPIVGMADGIVDIVETGDTLRANGLEEIEKICDISTRLIANKASLIFKSVEINQMISRLEANLT